MLFPLIQLIPREVDVALPDNWTAGYPMGDILPGSTHVITFRTAIAVSAPTNPNTGTIIWGCCPGTPGYETASDTVDLITQPQIPSEDIVIRANSDFNTCTGQKTITIHNNGARATVVTIIDNIPVGYIYDGSGPTSLTSNQEHTPAPTGTPVNTDNLY
jgi:hypothetical protein